MPDRMGLVTQRRSILVFRVLPSLISARYLRITTQKGDKFMNFG